MNPLFGHSVTGKLSRLNHATWKAQVFAAIRGARLQGHITGAMIAPATGIDGKDAEGKPATIPNPEYDEWYASDQQVLGFLLTSVSKEVLGQVAAKQTVAEV